MSTGEEAVGGCLAGQKMHMLKPHKRHTHQSGQWQQSTAAARWEQSEHSLTPNPMRNGSKWLIHLRSGPALSGVSKDWWLASSLPSPAQAPLLKRPCQHQETVALGWPLFWRLSVLIDEQHVISAVCNHSIVLIIVLSSLLQQDKEGKQVLLQEQPTCYKATT